MPWNKEEEEENLFSNKKKRSCSVKEGEYHNDDNSFAMAIYDHHQSSPDQIDRFIADQFCGYPLQAPLIMSLAPMMQQQQYYYPSDPPPPPPMKAFSYHQHWPNSDLDQIWGQPSQATAPPPMTFTSWLPQQQQHDYCTSSSSSGSFGELQPTTFLPPDDMRIMRRRRRRRRRSQIAAATEYFDDMCMSNSDMMSPSSLVANDQFGEDIIEDSAQLPTHMILQRLRQLAQDTATTPPHHHHQ